MGILRELFAKPIYGKNGALGDVALPTPMQYAHETADQRRVRMNQNRRNMMERRSAASPVELAKRIAEIIQEHGPQTASELNRRLRYPYPAIHSALEAGSFESQTGPSRQTRGGAPTVTWGLPPGGFQQQASGVLTNSPEQQAARDRFLQLLEQSHTTHNLPDLNEVLHLESIIGESEAERLREEYTPPKRERLNSPKYHRTTTGTPYHWIQAPPGGATLNGRNYRSGQFVPGTTMFTHKQRAINPEAPVPYSPLMQPGATQQQPDGTHAMPVPANSNQYIPGAPQSVGGEPLAVPGQGVPQGPSDMPPQSPQMAPQGQMPQQTPGIPTPVPQGPQPLRTPGLSPQDGVLEAQSQMFAWANYGALRDGYFAQNAKLDPVSGDVRSLTLNTDTWNSLIPGFTGINAPAVHQAAAWLNDQLFREALQNQTGKGNNKMLVIADGSPAGEGTKDYLDAAEYPLVLEQPSLDYQKLSEQFERARSAGMKPAYQYVDRQPAETIQGIVERALADRLAGRPPQVKSLDMLARSNIQARRTALEVLFRNPDVDATIIADHGGKRFARRMITDRGQASMYLAQQLAEDEARMPQEVERAKQELISRQKAGEIPADLLTGFLGSGWQVRPPVRM